MPAIAYCLSIRPLYYRTVSSDCDSEASAALLSRIISLKKK